MSDSRILFVSDTKTDARVAQLVEHDLAKVGVAGSSPVSRFFLRKDIRLDVFFLKRALPDSKVRVSPLRFGLRITEVHRTSCAVSRSSKKETILKGSEL